ncbi:hypothetical protein RIF23_10475 [Lipingzhangella sp. LS1_29]|uniref:Uncharacterized protein n=1 Tax=Lipingzhangella rawalii TaxID=2055835 RepID=A0ABU2H807_9ACTN|nr:hypothetical protein [Lipingzhangella rawalii]MDS1270724.1 hypothetical protein [Lipingzhangella rawalii]
MFHRYTPQDQSEVRYTETMVSSLALEDPLQAKALSPSASAEMIQRVRGELP